MRFVLFVLGLSVATAQVTSPSSVNPNGNADIGIFGDNNSKSSSKQLTMPRNNQPIGSSDIGIMISDNGTVNQKQIIDGTVVPSPVRDSATRISPSPIEKKSELSNTTVESMLSRNRTVERTRLRRFKDAKYMLVRRHNN